MALSSMFTIPTPQFSYHDAGYGVDSWLTLASPTDSFAIKRITVSWSPSDVSKMSSVEPRFELGFQYIVGYSPPSTGFAAQSNMSYSSGSTTTIMYPVSNPGTVAPPQVVWSPNASDQILTLNYSDISPSFGAAAGDAIGLSLTARYNNWINTGFTSASSVLDDFTVSVIIEEA